MTGLTVVILAAGAGLPPVARRGRGLVRSMSTFERPSRVTVRSAAAESALSGASAIVENEMRKCQAAGEQ
ncbi:MAG: hypothetical protein ACR2M5_03645 [Nakamurella sp.]